MTFEQFNLHPQILEAISYMGMESPTPIQELAIPEIQNNKDLLGSAQTGTGKTAAFILPILDKLYNQSCSTTNTLIIVPTRELALQIDQEIQGIAYFISVQSVAVYGGGDGADWARERTALSSGANIIVATPGKLQAHLNMGYVKFDQVQHLILDEADRMLDIGFYDDIMKIISYLPSQRQTIMFSATMPDKVKQLANQILDQPKELQTAVSKPAEGVLQACYPVYEDQKLPLINNLIKDKPEYKRILIFSSTKKKMRDIVYALKNTEKSVEWISSDLSQTEREEVLIRFKSQQTRVLVATDVLSRGIDIKDIDLIINYDVPGDPEDYIHRVGRTARAESTGVALTLVTEGDMGRFERIEQLIESKIIKLQVPSDWRPQPNWDASASKRKKKTGETNKNNKRR